MSTTAIFNPRANNPGRPRGSLTVRNRQVAAALSSDGKPMPLEIATEYMRYKWATKDEESRREAVEIALQIAPYFHPRMSAISVMDVTQQLEEATAQALPSEDLPRPPKLTVVEAEATEVKSNGSGNGAVH